MNFYRDRINFDGPVQFRSAQEVYDRVQNLKYIWEQRINEVLDGFNWTLHGEDLVEMEYVNTYPTIPHPITVDPVLDYEEENSTHDHAAFPESRDSS